MRRGVLFFIFRTCSPRYELLKEPVFMSARFSLDNLPTYAYKILIVIATAIWGVSFVFMKDVVSVLPPAWLLGIRFTCAGIILLLIMRKRVAASFNLRFLGMGVLLGVLDFSFAPHEFLVEAIARCSSRICSCDVVDRNRL